jgi:hypothetical protein
MTLLTEKEYNTLQEMKNVFDLLEAGVQDLPNTGGSWNLSMQPIYSRVFNEARPQISCGPCLFNILQRLLPVIRYYESTLKPLPTNEQGTNTDESSSTPNPDGTVKARGRKPKQWI